MSQDIIHHGFGHTLSGQLSSALSGVDAISQHHNAFKMDSKMSLGNMSSAIPKLVVSKASAELLMRMSLLTPSHKVDCKANH